MKVSQWEVRIYHNKKFIYYYWDMMRGKGWFCHLTNSKYNDGFGHNKTSPFKAISDAKISLKLGGFFSG